MGCVSRGTHEPRRPGDGGEGFGLPLVAWFAVHRPEGWPNGPRPWGTLSFPRWRKAALELEEFVLQDECQLLPFVAVTFPAPVQLKRQELHLVGQFSNSRRSSWIAALLRSLSSARRQTRPNQPTKSFHTTHLMAFNSASFARVLAWSRSISSCRHRLRSNTRSILAR